MIADGKRLRQADTLIAGSAGVPPAGREEKALKGFLSN